MPKFCRFKTRSALEILKHTTVHASQSIDWLCTQKCNTATRHDRAQEENLQMTEAKHKSQNDVCQIFSVEKGLKAN